MQLRGQQLQAHLAKTLAPLYTIYGDEPLLALEAADAVRAAARRQGFTERSVLIVQQRFDWSAFREATASRSLFGARTIVELRLPTGRPGTEGSAALTRYAASPGPEVLLLVTMPRPEGTGWWKSAWFTALQAGGVTVEVRAVPRAQLPAWIDARLRAHGLQAPPEALEYLADRVEGNLLAAHQEVQKLALLAAPGTLTLEQLAAAVANVARFDFDVLAEALYAGDFAHYCRALEGLRGEGESAAALAWRLGEELVALAAIRRAMDSGARPEPLYAAHRLWRSAHSRAERVLRRLGSAQLRAAAARVARIERQAKGVATGDPWDALIALGLEFAHGTESARELR